MRLLGMPARRHLSTRRRHAHPPFDAVLTVEGKRLLEAKADRLRSVTLPKLLDTISDDPSDPAAQAVYDGVVTELRRIESVLVQAQPIPAHASACDQVSLGDRITIAFLASGPASAESKGFLLVHPFEAPLDMDRISVTSPLGRAVVGHRVGDVVSFDTPTGNRSVRILERQPAT